VNAAERDKVEGNATLGNELLVVLGLNYELLFQQLFDCLARSLAECFLSRLIRFQRFRLFCFVVNSIDSLSLCLFGLNQFLEHVLCNRDEVCDQGIHGFIKRREIVLQLHLNQCKLLLERVSVNYVATSIPHVCLLVNQCQ